MIESKWKNAREASSYLNVSERQLFRWRKAGIFVAGFHFIRKFPNANSALLYQIELCEKAMKEAAPIAAQRLIDVINDENNRGYVVVQAVESLFRVIDRSITDRENAEQLKEIRESINTLEVGKVFDV